jgi:Zinc finger, C3HC4 type (RING finger)
MGIATSSFGFATDSWLRAFGNDEKELKRTHLCLLPYAVLESLTKKIQDEWGKWKDYIKIFSSEATNARIFISDLSKVDNPRRLEDLGDIASQINSLAISEVLRSCCNKERARQLVDQDLTMGFVGDIHPDSIKELVIEIKKNHSIDWRLLGDGLGFTDYDCRNFKDPQQLIEMWVELNFNASVCRLDYELAELRMNSCCEFLRAIPLEGRSKIYGSSYLSGVNHPPTKYDLMRLNEIFRNNGTSLDWEGLVSSTISEIIIKNNSTTLPMDLLWESSQGNLDELLLKMASAHTQQFRDELTNGFFEPTSPGGITFSQIFYLGSKVDLSNIKIDSLARNYLPEFHNRSPINFFGKFLMLYWQHSEGEKMNLREFCYKIISILQTCKFTNSESVIRDFKKRYQESHSWRIYDPILASQLKKKDPNNASEIAKNIDFVAQQALGQVLCTICMDRKINAVPLPCRHFFYCIECITDQANCPTCTEPITQKIQVFTPWENIKK